jgi:hypothetical protein
LKSRPNGFNCGPKAPTWQEAQGWLVWTANAGTARAGPLPSATDMSRISNPAQPDLSPTKLMDARAFALPA